MIGTSWAFASRSAVVTLLMLLIWAGDVHAGRTFSTVSVGTAVEIIDLAKKSEDFFKNDFPEFIDRTKYDWANFDPEREGATLAVNALSDMPTGDGVLLWFPVQRMGEDEKIGSYLPQGPILVGVGARPESVAAVFLTTPMEQVSPELANAMLGRLQYENGTSIPNSLVSSSMSKSYFLWIQKVGDGRVQIYRVSDSNSFMQEAVLDATRLKLMRQAQKSDDTVRNLALRAMHFDRLSSQFERELRQKNLKFDLDALMRARNDSSRLLKEAYENMARAREAAEKNKGLEGFAIIFNMMSLASDFKKLNQQAVASADYNESAADRMHIELQSIDVQIINIYLNGVGVDDSFVPQPSIPNPWKMDQN